MGGAVGGKMAGPYTTSPEEEKVVLGKMVCAEGAVLGKVGEQLVAGKMMGVDGGVSLEVGGDVVVLGVLVGGAFLWKPAPVVAMEVDHHQQVQRHVFVRKQLRTARRARPPGDRNLL